MRLLWLLSLALLIGVAFTTADDFNEFAEFEDDEPAVVGVKKEEETTTPTPTVTITKNAPKNKDTEFDVEEDFGLENPDVDDEVIDMSIPDSKDVPELNTDENIKAQPLKFADVPAHFRSNWGSYQVEAVVIFLLLVYLTNYLAGRAANQSIAFSWVDNHRDRLEEQFAVVGDDGLSETPSNGQLNRETDNLFSMWCSGRVGVSGCMVHIRTIKRQDLVSRIWGIFNKNYDRVTLTFDVDEGEMDSFVVAAGQRKSVTRLHKELLDLSQYTTEKKMAPGPSLPPSFSLFSESSEVASCLLDNAVLTLAKKYEDNIEYIHISDQYSGPKPPDGETLTRLPETRRVAVFSFILHNQSAEYDREAEDEMIQMAFYCVDKMRRFRLSREAKQKGDKRRQTAQELFQKSNHQARQEAAQARREEKTRERKQKLLEEEDPDKQRRLELLEYKKELKAKQPKMKQMKMK
ncbi:ccdc-47 [Pristionchus pacificus]|uniref:PAT complex subunit CCDC47 n=1 Tax=Pristionchus pacificus TaxID=54126 RepID=A0A454XMQ8_PRIPA|nr:ccdc-47 [Pristionchus pacificus]|eukprot:PDM67749.1 ccdc-47 [Pristionchus pacificus]